MAKTDFQLQDGETLFYEGTLNHVKGKLSVTEGTGFVTNKRLVRYEANMTLKVMIGLLAHFFKQKFDFELPLDQIRSIKRKEKGLNKKHALILTTDDGTEMQLVSFKSDDLITAFQQAFDQNPNLSFSELGHQEWVVQGVHQNAAAD